MGLDCCIYEMRTMVTDWVRWPRSFRVNSFLVLLEIAVAAEVAHRNARDWHGRVELNVQSVCIVRHDGFLEFERKFRWFFYRLSMCFAYLQNGLRDFGASTDQYLKFGPLLVLRQIADHIEHHAIGDLKAPRAIQLFQFRCHFNQFE